MDNKTALIPLPPDFNGLEPAHREFQRSIFDERRMAALGELRMLSGIPGLVRDLKPDRLYRLVYPEGAVLQKGKNGLYRGVLYRPHGGISDHLMFEKVLPNLARIGSAVGSQVLLVSIAMQLNRVEKAITGIAEELHDDRVAMILAGVQQYQVAMHITDLMRRDAAIQHAIQSLNEGLAKISLELRRRIDRLPEPQNTFWDNWGGSKTRRAASEFRMAEEAFKFAVHGASVLSECYAALDEPRAGAEAILHCMKEIASCGVDKAADKARMVEAQNSKCLPEQPWLQFHNANLDFIERSTQTPLDPILVEKGSVIIEFTKAELPEEI